MIPPNIYPTLFLSNESNCTLFKIAIHFAELGLNVWFISPAVFDKIPENVEPPNKEILQLITFVYLQDYKSLIRHLNAIHLWHKVPRVIILAGFDKYTNLFEVEYDPLLTGIITSTILDSASVCYKKNQQSTFIVVSARDAPDEYLCRLVVLQDMYFPNVIVNSEQTVILDKIVSYYHNK